ncbi:MAG: hypothetical protein KGJ80_17860, partial [Chloroflexota bacterium]|nr:hypothetical protein [Chloroflexota bacterium]
LADYVFQKAESKKQKVEDTAPPLPPFQTFLVVQFIMLHAARLARRSSLAPFAAGLVFAFAPIRLGYGLAFFNLFNTQLIPFYVLFLIRATRERSWRAAVVAGILLGLNAYIDFQIAAFLVLFSLMYAAYVLIADWRAARRSIARWASVALIGAAISAPMIAVLASDFAAEGGDYIRVFPLKYSLDRSYDLASFFVPNARSTLYADAPLQIVGVNASATPGDGAPFSPDVQIFVGYVALALAAYAALRNWRAARFWLAAAILFALFGLGPSLHFLGRDTGIPLPYVWLHEIPIVNNIRIPMRYGIMVAFTLALLVALGMRELRTRHSTRKLRIAKYELPITKFLWLVPAAILLEYAVLPYPVQALAIPKIYDDIARVPGDFTILEIPTFHWRGAAATEWYQAIHGKRILRVYTNRIAPGLAEYFGTRGIPIIDRSLRVLEGFEPGGLAPEDLAEDKRVRDQVLQFYDLRYAVLHRLYLKPEEVDAIDGYLRDVLAAQKIYDDGETIAYELPRVADAPGALRIDLRENIGQMYAGRGWQFEYPKANWEGQFDFVWARGAASEIYFVTNNSNLSLRGAVVATKQHLHRTQVQVSPDAAVEIASPKPLATLAPHASAGVTNDRVMTLHAYAETPQHVTISLNGARVGELTLTPEWKDYRVALPARWLTRMNVVRLEYATELQETIGVTTITIE